MIRHREKVLAHAEKQLALQGKENPAQLLSLYKKFLKIENHRLQLRHNAGGGGLEIAEERAMLMDIVLRHLFDYAVRKHGATGLSLVAIGGYGRGELNPYSDVDIMFLRAGSSKKTVPSEVYASIEAVLYMLWDIGFKVGHSTRTVQEAIQQANQDMLSKTSLLEARFVAGEKPLFEEFKAAFEAQSVRGHEQRYIEDRVKNQTDRHEKNGGSVYMQEPNIKNGCGSLRDYQNLIWVCHCKEHVSGLPELVSKKLLHESERRQLDRAYDFLLRVRTELHYLNKRPTDLLSLNFQFQIANKFGYPQKNILRRGEAFMRDYYQHSRAIFNISEVLFDRLCLTAESQEKRRGILKFFSKKKTNESQHFDGFYTVGNLLYPETREIFTHDTHRLIRVFQHVQIRKLSMSLELQQLIRRRVRLVDRTFQYSRSARETFAAILSRKGEVGRILRMMHQVDFLGRYIPEFGELTCLVQHEFFHRYTADEHTLVCIEKLDSLIDTKNPKFADYRVLFQKLEDPFVLYLALLLHDTGKAANAKHHAEASAICAQKVAARHQLSSEQRKTLIFLVDNHMVLSSTVQRRNPEDPATIEEFAGIMNNQTRLDALMLLTLADGQGTSQEGWSDWKESLVWHLYRSTSHFLADSVEFFRQHRVHREELREAVTKKMAKDYTQEIAAHFLSMPDTYFHINKPNDIIGHIRLFREFLEKRAFDSELALAPAVKWVAYPERGHSELWICTWDRTLLLAKIAGALALAQVNILSADIYTRSDNLVLDIFRVCDPRYQAVTDSKEMAQVEKLLSEALLQEDFYFQPLLQKAKRKQAFNLSQELDFPTRIAIDNDTHPVYTLVDIQTPDRLGLLYHLLRGFSEIDVNIALSRIATEKGAALDSFYITDTLGRKIRSAASIVTLQKALQRAAENATG